MDQQTVNVIPADNHYMTREFLEKSIADLSDEINNLKKFKEDLITQSNALHREHNNLKDSLRDWTRSELGADDITHEQALALAELGNFTLTKCYDVTILVEHSFSIELESGDDIDDVLGTMDFSANSYHTTLDNEDYAVVETNYDESE
jgi:regulator of replication initiation timing